MDVSLVTQPPAAADLGPEAGADLARTALALARRFSAGATMWCLAPEWPEHARHVAVEFVHPVVVGKRALPAVALTDEDPVAELRAGARAGDVLCVVSSAARRPVRAALQRARVWGLETVWLGAGDPGPVPGEADHVLWVDAPAAIAAYDGTLVLRYHVLWELTHVCFEHAGLLVDTVGPDESSPTCVTCADEGITAEVLAVERLGGAVVRSARGLETVAVELVAPVAAGDLVLVHAGTAIARVEAVA
ncbi:MAG: HupF/HypC family protein [Actinomycetia bacterium]|nr:HupF/HypC family protein [Actinomycetes bacterium]